MLSISPKLFSKSIIVLLFLGFIYSSPLLMLFTEDSPWSVAEKRSLAHLPSWPKELSHLSVFFSSLNDYIDDHFGFREFYIRRYHREVAKRFNKTSPDSLVIKGLNGWYFLSQTGLINDFLGRSPLSKNQIQTWFDLQGDKNAWLQERGIRYLYMTAPNKQSVYPQYLMENGLNVRGTSRFEQLRQYSDNHFPDFMLDLHQVLKPELFERPLYYKNDTHWNKLAAYTVFQKTIERLTTWFPDESFFTDFELSPDISGVGGNTGTGGDLVRMLMQEGTRETYPEIKPFSPCGPYIKLPYQLSNVSQKRGQKSFVRKCTKRNLRAVIFRDSFFVPLEPLFSENFKEIIYLWKPYDQKNIEEIMTHFTPDVVIEFVVERNIFESIF